MYHVWHVIRPWKKQVPLCKHYYMLFVGWLVLLVFFLILQLTGDCLKRVAHHHKPTGNQSSHSHYCQMQWKSKPPTKWLFGRGLCQTAQSDCSTSAHAVIFFDLPKSDLKWHGRMVQGNESIIVLSIIFLTLASTGTLWEASSLSVSLFFCFVLFLGRNNDVSFA